jgi:hypothetical protein
LTQAKPLPANTAAVFAAWPELEAARLSAVRAQILATAREMEGVGPLTETLKWGEPAYLTESPKTGTTIRLGPIGGQAAVMVNCRTSIIEDAKRMFGTSAEFSGTRGLILGGEPQALDYVIRAALSYHMKAKVPA